MADEEQVDRANREEALDAREYRVVANGEGQYSIWLASQDLPLGWSDCGVVGDRVACLSHIKEVWTDMRPKSLRN